MKAGVMKCLLAFLIKLLNCLKDAIDTYKTWLQLGITLYASAAATYKKPREEGELAKLKKSITTVIFDGTFYNIF